MLATGMCEKKSCKVYLLSEKLKVLNLTRKEKNLYPEVATITVRRIFIWEIVKKTKEHTGFAVALNCSYLATVHDKAS